jgi:hypothetical protein
MPASSTLPQQRRESEARTKCDIRQRQGALRQVALESQRAALGYDVITDDVG